MAFTTDTTCLTPGQFRAAKTRLTKALNSKDPQRVLAVVDETFATWDEGNFVYPDDWHRWERARTDASMALAYGVPMR